MHVQSYVSYSDATCHSALHCCFQRLNIVSSYHVSLNDILFDIHFTQKTTHFHVVIPIIFQEGSGDVWNEDFCCTSSERKIIACDDILKAI